MAKQQNAKQKKVQPMQFGATKLLEDGASRLMNLIKLGAEALTSGAAPGVGGYNPMSDAVRSAAEALSGMSSGNPNVGQMNANMEFVPYQKYTMETRSKNQSQGTSPAKKSSGKKKQTGPINEEPGQGYNPLSEGVYQELIKLARLVPPRELQPRSTQYYPPVSPQIGPNPEEGGTPYSGMFMEPVVYFNPGTPGPVGGVGMSQDLVRQLPNYSDQEKQFILDSMKSAAQNRQLLDKNQYGPEAYTLFAPNFIAQPANEGDPTADARYAKYPSSLVGMANYANMVPDYIYDARRGYGPTIDDGTNPFFRGDK